MLQPMRNRLESCKEIDIGLAISPDIMAFSVLRTLFVLGPVGGQSEAMMFSHLLPARSRGEPDFAWERKGLYSQCSASHSDTFSVHFAPSEHVLACSETYESDTQTLTVHTYNILRQLTLKVVGVLTFPIPNPLQYITFHPKLAIVAFQATWWSSLYHRAVIWQYRNSMSPKSVHTRL